MNDFIVPCTESQTWWQLKELAAIIHGCLELNRAECQVQRIQTLRNVDSFVYGSWNLEFIPNSSSKATENDNIGFWLLMEQENQ